MASIWNRPRANCESKLREQLGQTDENLKQRQKQNDEHFQRRVAEDRTRHLINPDGEFTPENDADYQADFKQITLEFEERMTWVVGALPAECALSEDDRASPADWRQNEWEKQESPEHTEGRANLLRQLAKKLRDQGMKYAYERHDLRKAGWSKQAEHHKRRLVLERHRASLVIYNAAQRRRQDKTVQLHEDAYARERKMPTDAEQKAGFPAPPSSPSSSSTHQLSLLPALENRLLHTARSSVHQFQHTAKALAPAFYAWEKRVSGSHPPGVQKVPLEAELKEIE
ncbi:MAG: hypothetical protein M1826_007516 [Phylliscum demangeonii]|nr:MAG: hypothetical protein M1826_007516 [Phylliscum demangeonii]